MPALAYLKRAFVPGTYQLIAERFQKCVCALASSPDTVDLNFTRWDSEFQSLVKMMKHAKFFPLEKCSRLIPAREQALPVSTPRFVWNWWTSLLLHPCGQSCLIRAIDQVALVRQH